MYNLIASIIIALAIIFHALWTTHNPIFFNKSEEFIVFEGAIDYSSKMREYKNAISWHIAEDYQYLPEYLVKQIIIKGDQDLRDNP